MIHSHRRHDISDKAWAPLEPHLPGREGCWGGVSKDNRLFINAVFWIMRMGAPWRDLPPSIVKSARMQRQSGYYLIPTYSGTGSWGLNTKIHLAMDAFGMPLRILVTECTREHCTQAGHLIEGISTDYLLADHGYDSNAILEQARDQGMAAVIPSKKNRKDQRYYDKDLYKHRHLVENAFLHLKRWRGIATRYAKNTASFLAAIQIRCIALWANIS